MVRPTKSAKQIQLEGLSKMEEDGIQLNRKNRRARTKLIKQVTKEMAKRIK